MMISPWNSSFEPYLKDHKFDNMPKVPYAVLEWGGYEFQLEENTFTANR
jgi:transcription termination factor NusB